MDCGSASVYNRDVGWPNLPRHDSAKGWYRTYFYVRNAMAVDHINLLAAQVGWSYDPWRTDNDTLVSVDQIQNLVSLGLTGHDLLMTWVSRRVIPLQRWPHKMCYLSGRLDPSRTSRTTITRSEAAKQTSTIINGRLDDNWGFGVAPYRRSNPPPK